jgi:hypothetical protein
MSSLSGLRRSRRRCGSSATCGVLRLKSLSVLYTLGWALRNFVVGVSFWASTSHGRSRANKFNMQPLDVYLVLRSGTRIDFAL